MTHLRPTLLAAIVIASLAGTAAAGPPGVTPIQGPSPYHAVPPIPGDDDLPAPIVTAPPGLTGKEAPSRRVDHGDDGFTIERSAFSAEVGPDGTMRFRDRTFAAGLVNGPTIGAAFVINFDLTDILMRWHGDDPYLVDKLALLDATRDERAAMRARSDEVVMTRALADLPTYLAAVWAYQAWPLETRRRILFALWDEAAEDGNELLRRGGEQARRHIEDFIGQVLPRGSELAFSAAELEYFNSVRGSRVAFAPYHAAPALERVASDDALDVLDPDAAAVAAAAHVARALRAL